MRKRPSGALRDDPQRSGARSAIQGQPQGLDWAKPPAAGRDPVAALWKQVKAAPGGPHEIARRADLPVHTLAQILIGREPCPAGLCQRVAEALAEGRSPREVSLPEVRWANLVRLLNKAFRGWPPKMGEVLGIEETLLRQLLMGSRRMTAEMARSIEAKMALPGNWLDQTEEGDRLTGVDLRATRVANLLLHFVADGAKPEDIGNRLSASSDRLVVGLTEQLARHREALVGKEVAEIIAHCDGRTLVRIGHGLHHDEARLAERQLGLADGVIDLNNPPPPG